MIYAKIAVNNKVHLLSIKTSTGSTKMVEVDLQATKHYYFLGKVRQHNKATMYQTKFLMLTFHRQPVTTQT